MRLDFSFRNKQEGSFRRARPFVWLLCFVSFFAGCARSADESPVAPPETYPLSRGYIGFGVVNVSFTHFLSEPGARGVSQAYLRQGTIVRVVERRTLTNRDAAESWVLAEENLDDPIRGWLRETSLEIYENESRALTAAKNMDL